MYGYNQQANIDIINNKIQELERLKNNYQTMPQQAPVNIYNNTMPMQNDFKARILNENEKVDEILVNCKTAFIDLKNGVLSIKEINGDIKEYEIVLPKDEKDLKIEELERKLREYEQSNDDITVVKKQKSYSDDRTDSKNKS